MQTLGINQPGVIKVDLPLMIDCTFCAASGMIAFGAGEGGRGGESGRNLPCTKVSKMREHRERGGNRRAGTTEKNEPRSSPHEGCLRGRAWGKGQEQEGRHNGGE